MGIRGTYYRYRQGRSQPAGVAATSVALSLLLALTLLTQPGCDRSTGPAANTPSQISWSPLQARVGEPYRPNLTVTDPDGIDRVVVSGPGAGATFSPSGAASFAQVLELDYDAPGEPVYQVAVTDARGETENASFTVTVHPRGNSPAQVSFGPANLPNRTAVSLEGQVSDLDGIHSIHVYHTVADTLVFAGEYDGLSEVTFSQPVFYDYPRAGLPEELAYRVVVTDAEQDSSEHAFTIRVNARANPGPSLTVEPAPGASMDEDFRLVVQGQSGLDNVALGELTVNWGNEQIVLEVAGESVDTMLAHRYEQGGSYSWQVRLSDAENISEIHNGSWSVVGLYSFEVMSRGFFNKEVNAGASLHMMHVESGRDTVLATDGAGRIYARLPGGVYEVLPDGGVSLLSRLAVRRDFYDDDWQFLSYLDGGERAWVISGYERQPFYLTLGGDVSTVLETVEDVFILGFTWGSQGVFPDRHMMAEEFLGAMSQQLGRPNAAVHGRLIVPRVKDGSGNELTHKMVYNRGNTSWGNCNVSDRPLYCNVWNIINRVISPEDLPDGGNYPPGTNSERDFNSNAELYFDTFVGDLKGVLDGTVVLGNPYKLEVVKGNSHELTNYLNSWYNLSPTGIINLTSPKDQVVFHGHNSGGGVESYSINSIRTSGASGNYFIRASHVFVPGGSSAAWKNETTYFGLRNETNGVSREDMIGSRRDDERYASWMFSGLDGATYLPIDVRIEEVLAGFGPWSQLQRIDYLRTKSFGQDIDGFNVKVIPD